MKCKFYNLFFFFVMFSGLLVHAQEGTITGTVSDDTGPLPGVSIIIKGTTTGTETDFDGKYAIKANTGDVLVFSFVGMATQEIIVGTSNTIDVVLVADNVLDEVIVTALGIKREKKALGYAVSEVSSKDLEQKSQPDLGRLLKGKAAGVNVQANNGLTGSGTNVVIRGYTSITGNNQALFVIDGVPFESGANEQTDFIDGVTESSRFLDIDPNNIKNVSILKGLSATALYGNRGRNGVVLITTKSGSIDDTDGKAKLTISSSVFFSEPHLPNYQDQFGGGFNSTFGWFFSNWGPEFTDTNPASYGTYFSSVQNGVVQLTHPFATNTVPAFIVGFEDLRDSEYAYVPYNSVEDFFKTGISNTTSVSLTAGNNKFAYNVGYTNLNEEGFTPGNSLKRDNFTVGGSATHGKLKVNATINFTRTNFKSPPIAASRGSGVLGAGSSLFSDIFYTPRNVDLIGIPFERLDGGSLYYRETNGIQHPLWTVKHSKTGQHVNNIFGSFNVSYALTDYLTANYRYGINTFNEGNFYSQDKGGVDGDTTGILRTTNVRRTNVDHNISLVFNTDLTEKLDLTTNVGFNSNRRELDREGVESTGQIVFGVTRHFNFTNQSTINSSSLLGIQGRSEENTYGVYGDITLGYDNFLYLNVQGRNDWTSTLESDNNTIFYPSASISFIPTTVFEGLKSNKWGLNYLKLRAGFGSSAGFAPTFTTRTTLDINGNLFVDNAATLISGNSTSDLLGNPDLEPETVEEIEVGLESRFLDNRVTLNVSIFKKETKDLITRRGLDPSTGFTDTFINGGDLEVEGIELDVNLHVIKSESFNWNLGLNFYADESEITRLPEGIDRITIGGSLAGSVPARNAAVVGQPFGVFLGSAVQTDANGEFIVGADGNYVVTPDINQIVGDPNPDFTSSLQSTFSYKDLSLGVNFSYRKGGDIYSTTAATLQNRGVIAFPLSRFESFVLPGVSQTTGQPNTVQINATDVAFDNWLFGPSNFRIYDGSFIRLSEVSLSYSLSKKLLAKTPFNALNLTISGSNLWYKAINIPDDANFDVNSNSTGVGNNLGLDFFSGPSAARYGFSLKIEL